MFLCLQTNSAAWLKHRWQIVEGIHQTLALIWTHLIYSLKLDVWSFIREEVHSDLVILQFFSLYLNLQDPKSNPPFVGLTFTGVFADFLLKISRI